MISIVVYLFRGGVGLITGAAWASAVVHSVVCANDEHTIPSDTS
jgi:hypothetical protein